MVPRWNLFGFQRHWSLCIVLILHLQIHKSWSVNDEGLALLAFRERVKLDPYGAFSNWNPNDSDPCTWFGVNCVNAEVEKLDLKELSLEGTLAPELGKLQHLRAIVLYKNHFVGIIPKEIAELTMLELLDLRANRLTGIIPVEMVDMLSLKYLLICDNNFEDGIPLVSGKLNVLNKLQSSHKIASSIHRKLGHCTWECSSEEMDKTNSDAMELQGKVLQHFNMLAGFTSGKGSSQCYENLPRSTESYIVQNVQHIQNPARRRLAEESSNLAAAPANGAIPVEITTIPSIGSGSFSAIPDSHAGASKEKQSPASTSLPPENSPSVLKSQPSSGSTSGVSSATPTKSHETVSEGSGKWKIFVLPAGAFLLIISGVILFMCRSRGVATIGPWKTGLSGQLQKAFVTGVPKLNRAELESACEDFSNIIGTFQDHKLFKGTLSSGVEIAVASTVISSAKDWSKHSERYFRKRIDTMSRVNHKNFVNLLGYCEEEEPFLRMMVFEYAPSGLLFEHLHVKEAEHLDWPARMRIVMGVAYCLQYMHHELNPPVVHSNLQSTCIYLTDDFAAKICENNFWKDFLAKGKISGEEDADPSELLPVEPESNVYSFGLLLLEVISGKLPYSEEQGSLVNWATDYLNDKRNISYLIDPTLKSFKKDELEVICEVIQDCINPDPRQRPTMKEITVKLRDVLGISSDAATPRLSPLWWAELEILSVEAS